MLRFSGQKLDDRMLMKFSARFGELDRVPISAASLDRANSDVDPTEAAEWVAVIASVKKDGKAVGSLGSYELVWHTDMSYNPLPPRASLLYALEVPADGGNTGFLNMYAAYETLPAELKRAIEGKTCIHDSSRNSAGELRKGFQRTHRRRAIRRGPCIPSSACIPSPAARRCSSAAGPAPTSTGSRSRRARRCSTPIWAHATQEKFAWYQKWRAGDLVMWDNRCVMHRRDAFDESLRRLMHRTQIVGETVLAG